MVTALTRPMGRIVSGVLVISAVLLAVGLIQMITPSSEAVRVRNALIFDAVDLQEMNWVPPRYPESFKLEASTPPGLFQEAANQLVRSSNSSANDFEAALAIGRHLAVGEIKGGAIQSDTASTFATIMSQGTGYCADFTQVFNGLAHAAVLPVREWGMSFDGFGGRGHAFNEVFDRDRGQWIFIDTFYSFYVVDRLSSLPISALDFRGRLRDRSTWPSVQVVPISDVRFGFKSEKDALEYYAAGADEFYLYWGNNVFQYDNSALVKLAGRFSRSAEQAIAIMTGVHPQIRIPRLPENSAAIDSLGMIKTKFILMISLEMIVLVVLLFQLVTYLYHRSRHRSSSRSRRALT